MGLFFILMIILLIILCVLLYLRVLEDRRVKIARKELPGKVSVIFIAIECLLDVLKEYTCIYLLRSYFCEIRGKREWS